MIHDKQGNSYTFKQFIAKWKQGLEGITPLQQIKSQIQGTRLMMVGLVAGLIVLAFSISKTWWIEIILAAGLFNTTIQLIGLIQRRNVLQQFNKHAVLSKEQICNVLNQEQEVI